MNRINWSLYEDDHDLGQLNWLAREILESLWERVGDEAYIDGKIDRLSGMDRYDLIVWSAGNLDEYVQAILARRIGVEPRLLRETLLTVKNHLQFPPKKK